MPIPSTGELERSLGLVVRAERLPGRDSPYCRAEAIATIRPNRERDAEIELQIDRFGQAVKTHFDVRVGRVLNPPELDFGAKDRPFSRII